MKCHYYEQVSDAYLLGEIGDPEWRQHLSECLACTMKLREETDFDLIIGQAVNQERVQTDRIEARVRAPIRPSFCSSERTKRLLILPQQASVGSRKTFQQPKLVTLSCSDRKNCDSE